MSLRSSLIVVVLLSAGIGAMILSGDLLERDAAAAPKIADTKEVAGRFGELPMIFEPNEGQSDESVRFLSRGPGYGLFLTEGGAVMQLSNLSNNDLRTTIKMTLAGGNVPSEIRGETETKSRVNYLIGSDQRNWKTDVRTFAKVRYAGVYNGIDLVFYGRQNQLEYDFIVTPGADPSAVRMNFDGADSVTVDERSGELVIGVAGGEIRHRAPIVFQESDGVRSPVDGRYQSFENGEIGFSIGEYDREKTLVIDPILLYSSYLGGPDSQSTANDGTVARGDAGYAVAVDGDGNAYVAGATHSTAFPLVNQTQSECRTTETGNPNFGCIDAFVSKFDATGTALIYSTYLGGLRTAAGQGIDVARGIAADVAGNAFVTGFTNSPDFPTTVGSFQRFFPCLAGGNGGGCSFVTKLGPGGAIIYSTFLGGNASAGQNFEGATSIAIDAGGKAYVTGKTQTASFPVRNGFRTKCHVPRPGNPDTYCDGIYGFLTKFNADGSALEYSTFIGGEPKFGGALVPIVSANDLAVDDRGNAYIVGGTNSNFTVRRALPGQSTFRSNPANCTIFYTNCLDGFVTVFDTGKTGATSLKFATFLGGESFEEATGVAVDASRSIFVTGFTNSLNFPVSANADDNFCGNSLPCTSNQLDRTDVFLTKIKADYSGIAYSTFIGGDAGETGGRVAVDPAGRAFVTATTNSTDLPTTADALQLSLGGAESAAFLAQFAPSGARDYSTYLRGTRETETFSRTFATDIFVDDGGQAYLTGATTSHDFPLTSNAFQRFNRAVSDEETLTLGHSAFLTKIGTPQPVIFIPGVSGSYLKDRGDFEGIDRWIGIGTNHRYLTLNPASEFFRGTNIYASDAIRNIGGISGISSVYGDFLSQLVKKGGYREYNVNGDPLRRTLGGCDVLNQQSTNPTLFVFAYDWRRDNVETANVALDDYVQCIQQFYGANVRINIVAHSMGNYVARRYILDHPGKVAKHISIGAPWLGGPKLINVLETGQFFDRSIEKFTVAGDDDFKFLVEDFAAAHQILPSRAYFELGGSPYREIDANGNLRVFRYDEFVTRINQLHSRTNPGETGRIFHDYAGQDDHRIGGDGVQNYNIYGVGSTEDTISRVQREPEKTLCKVVGVGIVQCRRVVSFKLFYGLGDGTVPRLSAARTALGQNLNAPGAKVVPYISTTTGNDGSVEHTELMDNVSVQQAVRRFLAEPAATPAPQRPSKKNNTPSQAIPAISRAPLYAMNFTGLDKVIVTDEFGNTTAPLPEDPSFSGVVPRVNYRKPAPDVASLTLPVDQNFDVTFTIPADPIAIEWTKGTAKQTTKAVRYADLNLPVGVRAHFSVTAQGIGDLRYDSDGDGTFETIAPPTSNLDGAAANDRDAPLVTIAESANSQISVVANDAESGVRSIMVSTDGINFQTYAGPFAVAGMTTVYAFADDHAGNRSAMVNRRAGTASATIAGTITANDGSGVSDVVLRISDGQNELANSASVGGGIYRIAGIAPGTERIITPQHPHYDFSPANATVPAGATDTVLNFTATRRTHSISGRVTDESGVGVVGAMISLSNGTSMTTASDGGYSFPALPAGDDYAVTVSLPFFVPDKPALEILELDSDETVNFSGIRQKFSVAGRISDAAGNGFANVTVTAQSGTASRTTTTDASGFYFFDGLGGGGDYVVTPTRPGATFVPQNLSVQNLADDESGDFASPSSPNTWTGEVSADWYDDRNWLGGAVPPSGASVLIPSSAVNEIVIGTNDVFIGGLYLAAGRTITVSAGRQLGVSGDAMIEGSLGGDGFFNCAGTATLAGSVPQALPAASIQNLTINNLAGVALLGDVSVFGTLDLAGGVIDGGAFMFTLESSATVVRTAGFIAGSIRKNFPGIINDAQTRGPATFVFPGGTITDGVDYSPVEVTVNSVSGSAGYLTIRAVDSVSPASILGPKITRYWDLDGSNVSVGLVFHYADEDDDAIVNPAGLRLFRGNQNVCQDDCVDETNRTATIGDTSSFSSWTVAGFAPTAANVTISGRVIGSRGSAIPNALVRLTRDDGVTISVRTNSFGVFTFPGVVSGRTYVVSASYRTLTFSARVINADDDVSNVDLIANSE